MFHCNLCLCDQVLIVCSRANGASLQIQDHKPPLLAFFLNLQLEVYACAKQWNHQDRAINTTCRAVRDFLRLILAYVKTCCVACSTHIVSSPAGASSSVLITDWSGAHLLLAIEGLWPAAAASSSIYY